MLRGGGREGNHGILTVHGYRWHVIISNIICALLSFINNVIHPYSKKHESEKNAPNDERPPGNSWSVK